LPSAFFDHNFRLSLVISRWESLCMFRRRDQRLMCIFRWSQTCLWICDGEDSCLWMSAHFLFVLLKVKAILMQENGAEQDLNPKVLQRLPSLAPIAVGSLEQQQQWTYVPTSKCHDDFILKQEHAKMALSICCVCYERFLSVDTTSNAVIAVAVDPPATSAVPLISSTPALSAAASSTDHTNVRERKS